MKQKLKAAIKKIIGQKIIDKIVGKRDEQKDLLRLKEDDRDLINKIKSENLTYLSNKKLASLTETCRAIEESGMPGLMIEAGCALGGSSILLASLKANARPLHVFDVFGMIPPPTEEDSQDVHDRYRTIVEGKSTGLAGNKYYGYEDNLYEIVQNNFRSFGIDIDAQSVSLIKGLVQDTMHIEQPVALAHIDVDWYDPVMTCLEKIFPNLVSGGSIILDDYFDWGGCRKATDAYLRKVVGQFTLDDSAGSMKITKK